MEEEKRVGKEDAFIYLDFSRRDEEQEEREWKIIRKVENERERKRERERERVSLELRAARAFS